MLIVDNFAGGGGASTGIRLATGRDPDIAVNHDPEALAMHGANHPATRHYCESVWDVDPREVTGGRPVGLAWFSPDCTFHSKARGGKPHRDRNRARRRRGLAWVVIRWAKAVRPRVIILENVEEFAQWGPLLEDGRPCPLRRGFTFRRWVASLENCGYVVEARELRACDYGAPTSRKRLFVIARCDGQPIAWPSPTHGPGRAAPYRTAAECIDWTIPCPSIFDRPRPLAENTLRRIARGIRRYVIEAARPFIVGVGGRQGQSVERSVGTVVASQKHALVSAFLAKHYGGGYEGPGAQLDLPAHTVTATDHHALVAAHLVHLRGGLADHQVTGQAADAPVPTITASGTHIAEVRAFLVAYYGVDQAPQLGLPLPTATTRDRFGLVTVEGTDYQIADIGMRMLTPRELFRAQGFPDDYQIDPVVDGKPLSKAAQVRMCGNSVCPPLAAALVRANVGAAAERPARVAGGAA